MELKQVIILRQDLQLPKGKACAQAAHASVEAALNSPREKVMTWHNEGQKKVVLKVADEKELREILKKAKAEKLVASLITDAGRTVVAPGTVTALGIGPDDEEKIDLVTGNLKML